MNFFFALVIASLCVAAYSSPIDLDDVDERGIWDSTVNVAKKLKSKLQDALAVAKGKLAEFVKVLGERKDVALAQLSQLKEKLVAEAKQKAKETLEQAKQQAAQIALAEIQNLLGDLDSLKEKIDRLEQ